MDPSKRIATGSELSIKAASSSLSAISSEASLAELLKQEAVDTVVLGEFVVHRSENGLYNMNDVHKASGGEDATKPAKFLEVAKNKAIIKALQALTPDEPVLKVVRGGANSGTWGSDEVVYKYAAWISEDFDAIVLTTFKKLVRHELAGIKQAAALVLEKYGQKELEHVKTLGELAAMTKDAKDSRIILRALEDQAGYFESSKQKPKLVMDYLGLQKVNTVKAIHALENAQGALTSVKDDIESILYTVRGELGPDISNRWRTFLKEKLAKPLEEAVSILATKIEETGESLRKGYNFKHGVSRFVDKDD